MGSLGVTMGVAALAAAAFVVFVPTWDHGPVQGTELGFPQAIQFASPRAQAAINQAPAALPAAATGGATAAQTYKNVQVLGDVSAAEFMRTQQAITAWVAPKQGCDFCHAGQDFASDAKPAKLAARTMLRMTRHLNADWATHVAPAGVTCFTCHRGQPVPAEIWFPSTPPPDHPMMARHENWRESADTVRGFFPDSGYSEYLLQDNPIRVQSTTTLPGHTVAAQVEAKRVYEMMMTMSDGIGVNCGFCHNSRIFESWQESTPYRWDGYFGIKLLQDINSNFLVPLAKVIPQDRELVQQTALPVLPPQERGKLGGNGLALCATCHYGLPKPLGGANMLHDYPALGGAAP